MKLPRRSQAAAQRDALHSKLAETISLTLLLGLIALIIFVLSFALLWDHFYQELTQINMAVMGNLLQNHPELKDEIVQAFLNPFYKDTYDVGLETAEGYGLNENTTIQDSLLLNRYKTYSVILVIGLGLAVLTVALLSVLRLFKQIGERNQVLALGADKIMSGDLEYRFAEQKEDEWAVLETQFNQMAKRLHLTLRALEEEKVLLRNMISDISHQLKTPLASLRTFNDLLITGAADNSMVRKEFLEKSTIQIDRMEWLTHTLLKMSRLEAGVIPLNRSFHDLKATLTEVLDHLKNRWQDKELLFTSFLPAESCNFAHDREWLGEALGNIVKNAIDFTPNGGAIEVRLLISDTMIRIEVKDSGVGIKAEDLPHIFNRFFQGQATRGMTAKGSGIGLALAKLIIEKHGGFIHVRSEPDQGSTFTLSFPKAHNIPGVNNK